MFLIPGLYALKNRRKMVENSGVGRSVLGIHIFYYVVHRA